MAEASVQQEARTGRMWKSAEGVEQTNLLVSGAGGRDRTGTGLLGPRDFKSLASANFATPA
jgi:hypothetical protein